MATNNVINSPIPISISLGGTGAITAGAALTNLGAVSNTAPLNTLAAPTGSLSLNSQKIINLLTPTLATDGANKSYVDGKTWNTTQITNFNAAVTAYRLDQFAVPTASLSLGSQKIINLLTPTLSTDAATKGYVDSAISGSALTLTGAVTGSGSGTINTDLNINQTQTSTQNFIFNNLVSQFSLNNQYIAQTGETAINRFSMAYGVGQDGYFFQVMSPFGTGGPGIKSSFALVQQSGIVIFQTDWDVALNGYKTNFSSTYVSINGSSTAARLVVNGGMQNVPGEDSCLRVTGSSVASKIELENYFGKLYEIRSDSTGGFIIFDRTTATNRLSISSAGDVIVNNTYFGRRVSGIMNMQGNVLATTITSGGLFYKVAGTTASSSLNGLSSPSSNRLTWTSANSGLASVNVSLTATHNGAGGDEIQFAIYKNGSQISHSIISGQGNNFICYSLQALTAMTTNDYVELYCSHPVNGKTITVKNMIFQLSTT